MRRVRALAGMLLCVPAMTSTVFAHWEYTRWGMSADEVRAVAKDATDNSDRELDGSDFKTLLLAPHAWGPIKLRVDFRFDDATGKLNSVGLRPLEGRDCDAIRKELSKRHGKAVPDAPVIAKWQTKARDVVTFSKIGTCRIDYIRATYPKVP